VHYIQRLGQLYIFASIFLNILVVKMVRTIPVFFVYSMYAERPIHSFYLDFLFGSYSFFICILFVVLLVFICIDIDSIRRLGGNGEW
jgi:hypothetical protein